MRSTTWLVMGLACALSGAALGQPAGPAPAPAKTAAPKKPPVGKSPPTPQKVAIGKAGIDVAAMTAALNGADNDAAIKAAKELAQSIDPAAHEALLDALAWGMPGPVAVATIQALGAHRAPPDVDNLVRYAVHHNPGVRSAAIGALAMYPAPAARRAVIAGLRDMNPSVRGAAAAAAAQGRVREAIEPLFELLARNEEAAGKALAAMADASLARKIGEQFGKVPEPILAMTLGAVLKRPDFGPDEARVDLVRAIGKIQDASAITALTDYVDATPKNPPRESREEARKMVEARLGGGVK